MTAYRLKTLLRVMGLSIRISKFVRQNWTKNLKNPICYAEFLLGPQKVSPTFLNRVLSEQGTSRHCCTSTCLVSLRVVGDAFPALSLGVDASRKFAIDMFYCLACR